MTITAKHAHGVLDHAYTLWLSTICSPERATALLRRCGNPRGALRMHLGSKVESSDMLRPWVCRVTRLREQGIRPITVLDGRYPQAWRGQSWAPTVLWQKLDIPVAAPRVAVFGGLNDTASATAPAGAVGAWLASRCVTVTALADADAAGAAALKSARTASRDTYALPVLTQGLAAKLPKRSPFPLQEWGAMPAESVANPFSIDMSSNAVAHATHMMLSRADAVVITAASARCDVTGVLYRAGIPVVVLGSPSNWAVGLLAEGIAVRATSLAQLPNLLRFRKRHVALAA